MRYLSSALVAAAVLAVAPLASAQIDATKLTVTGYQFISETPSTQTWSYVTYRADVINTGATLGPITATAALGPSVQSAIVVSGMGNLHFPGEPHNSQTSSTNTFTLLIDRTANFSFNSLQWSFTAPVANAGPNQTVPLGSTVNLTAAASTNPSELGTLTYSWAFTKTPAGSAAALVSPTSVTPTFIADVAGNYVVTVSVSNGSGTDYASVTVSTSNSGPVANAGPNQSVAVGSTVHLDGSQSNDIDGNPITYLWKLVQVPAGSQAVLANATSVNPTFVADLAGTYMVQLVVNDGSVNSPPSMVTITTTPGNTPPVANAGPSQVVTVGTLVQLNGSNSTDVDGNPLTYKWSLPTVPSGSTAALSATNIVNPTFTADLGGTYIAQLIVNDGLSDSSPSTVTITTSTVQAPTANAGPNQTVKHGTIVTLSGSGTDPQGLPLTLHWSLISAPAGSQAALSNPSIPNPTFTADFPGSYVAQLIVNNGVLNSAPSMVTITTTNTAPIANPGQAQTVGVGSLVILSGTGSYDPDADPITFKWSLLSAPQGSTTSIQFPTSSAPDFVADVAGSYVVQLIVNDGFVNSAPATVTIVASSGAVLTLTPNPLNIFTNATGLLTVSVGIPASGNGLIVTLTAFDPTVATAPATVTIPAGSMSTTAVITPVGVGGTTLFASAPGFHPGSTQIQVSQAGLALSLSANTLALTKTATGTVTLAAPAPSPGVTVNLSVSPTGPLTFVSSILIPTGSTVGTFTITGAATGMGTITASAPGYSGASGSITVFQAGAISLQANASVVAGGTAPFGVSLVTAAPVGGTTVTLVSSDTTKLTVTPSVFIAQGATTPSTSAQITGVVVGSVTVTASAPGFTGDSKTVTIAQPLAITNPSPLPNGAVGAAYNVQVNATGGVSPYTFSVTGLPAGLTMNSAGAISGTPTAIGTSTAQVTVTDSTSPTHLTATAGLSITINALSITTASPLPNGVANVAYVGATVAAAGGTGPYTFSVTGLPAGLTMNAAGVISGTPSAAGTSTAQVTVTDSTSPTHLTATAGLSITIIPTLAITPATLPSGVVNAVYSGATVTATGGTTPYTFTVTGLAAGLTMNSSGMISGTPTTAGTTTATFTVTDSSSPTHLTATLGLPITINPALAITPATLPSGTVNVAYSGATIAATGGTGPYTFTVSGLAAGLTMNSSGVISGTPTTAGTTTATFTVTDSSSPTHLTATLGLPITINATLAITPQTLPTGTANIAYSGATIAATGGTTPYTFTVAGLPAGLTMNSSGVISGTPTTAGTTTATFTVTDSSSPTHLTATLGLPITINATLAITPQTLPTGTVNLAYSGATVAATGGTGPYTFTATGLAAGLTMNSSGVISGTPTTAGTTTATFTVTDSTSPTHLTATLGLPITINPALAITPQTLPTGTVNSAYAGATIAATGGTSPYTFTVTGLAAGLTMNSSGVISGTPTTAGTTTATFTVTDSTSPTHLTATLGLSITINAPLAITPQTLPTGTANVAYSGTTIVATGGTGPYTFTVTGLAAGLTMNSSGVISGTPTTAGTTTATFTVTDSSSPTHLTATLGLSITINATLAITPTPLPNGIVNVAYVGATIVATGGTGPYTYSVTGLAAGLTMNAAGAISGTPSTAGTTTATFTVTDSTSPTHLTATVNLPITISGALAITPTPLPTGTVNVAYSGATVVATGGTAPYTFTVTGLPAGLTMNSAGVISGTPTTAGTTTATFTVTDSTSPTHLTATLGLSITINATLAITPQTLPSGTVNAAYAGATIAATGGSAPYTFSVTGLAAGLTMNSLGVISGTPTTAGTTTATFTVTDSSSPTHLTATLGIPITINAALTITPQTLPIGTVNIAYSGATIAATGGTGPYTFTVTGLAAGLTMNSSGVISGTPTSAGTSTATFTVTDSTSPTHLTATLGLPITIHAALAITPTPLPGGTVNAAYVGATLAATGGTSPYTFTVTGLAAGLTMNSSGVISGTPTTAGTTTATFTVTDSSSPTHLTATLGLPITINPALAITPQTLPTGTANVAYTGATIAATGGTSPYTFTVTGLAAGLTMNSSGVISGTPTTAGTTTATFTVTDSTSPTHLTATLGLPITINGSLTITTPSPLPSGAVNSVYSGATVAASGGMGPYTFTVTGLAAGLTMNSAGVISGTPTTAGTTTATVTVTDSTSPTHLTANKGLAITINPALAITTASPLPGGTVNVAYIGATIAATGGTGPYTFTVTGLAAGLTMNSAGVISGTPSTAGTTTATFTVTDSTSPTNLTATAGLSITINPALTITTASPLPTGAVNSAYSGATVAATGGTGPYTFTVTGLAAGLTMNSAGVISGTPTSAGTTTATVTVTDSTSPTHLTANKGLAITINAALAITTTSPLQGGVVNAAYGVLLAATGGTSPYTYTVTGLPTGLTMNSSGAISGTPTTAGTSTAQVTVTDSTSPTHITAMAGLSITINPALVITTTSPLPSGTVNAAYSGATVAATGGTSPYTFTVTGLAAGLTMNTSGVISGTPTTVGTTTAQVTVTDSTAPAHVTAMASLAITINPPPLVITQTSLPTGTSGNFYSVTLTATGGTSPYTFSATGLPAGLSINAGGTISGTPSSFGSTTVTVTVTDSTTPTHLSTMANLSLTINPSASPQLSISSGSVGQGLQTQVIVSLSQGSPPSLPVTITSANPGVVALASHPGDTGTGTLSLTLSLNGGDTQFSVFIQGVAASGTPVLLTVSAPGYMSGTSTVTTTHSAFVLSGPNGIGGSFVSSQSVQNTLTVSAVQVDGSGNPGVSQQVAGGTTQTVNLNFGTGGSIGSLNPSGLSFTSGTSSMTSTFTAGTTAASNTITAVEPSGFSTPANSDNVLAVTIQPTAVIPGNFSVGQNFETSTNISLQGAAGSVLCATVTSNDPTKLLFLFNVPLPGSCNTSNPTVYSSQITVAINAGATSSPSFTAEGLANTGSATYTVSVPGFGSANGTATFMKSGFVISGPAGLGANFSTTSASPASFINVFTAVLDSSGNYVTTQNLATGLSMNVSLTSSDPTVGTITTPVTILGGTNFAQTDANFQPIKGGTTTLSVVTPSGYTTPLQKASMVATVTTPNMLIDGGNTIGWHLQQPGTIILGGVAPAGGLLVTLTVTAGSMVLSQNGTDAGSASIGVTIPAGTSIGTYHMYSQANSGTATVTATAPGFATATGTETLVPSGIVIEGPFGTGSTLSIPLSGGPANFTVTTAQLTSGLAYFEDQPLAGGLTATMILSDSPSGVGTVPGTVTLTGGPTLPSKNVAFTPTATGSTTVTVFEETSPLLFQTPTGLPSSTTMPVSVH